MAPSQSSAPDTDLDLAKQKSSDRQPNAYTARAIEANTAISYGVGGAGNLRRPSQTASARDQLSELRHEESRTEDGTTLYTPRQATLFKSTTGQDATGMKASGEGRRRSSITAVVDKIKGIF